LKEKTGPDETPCDSKKPFGEGSIIIANILLLLKKNRWPITADIEFEYPTPDWSNAVEEVKDFLNITGQYLLDFKICIIHMVWDML
jgi:hypothetical protein